MQLTRQIKAEQVAKNVRDMIVEIGHDVIEEGGETLLEHLEVIESRHVIAMATGDDDALEEVEAQLSLLRGLLRVRVSSAAMTLFSSVVDIAIHTSIVAFKAAIGGVL